MQNNPWWSWQRCLLTLIIGVLVSCLSWGSFTAPAAAIDYNKRMLRDADFSGQDLRGSSFRSADLRRANFSHANLEGVSFFSANLESVNFEGANLYFAEIASARLDNTNFQDADLEGALASGARFRNVNIDGADFTDVYFRRDVEDQLCKIASGTNPTTKRNTIDTLWCP